MIRQAPRNELRDGPLVLTRIVDTALHHRGVVVALAVLALIFGIESTRRAQLDVFPEFAPPQIGIQTEAPGFAADQVKLLVTTPLVLSSPPLLVVPATRVSWSVRLRPPS